MNLYIYKIALRDQNAVNVFTSMVVCCENESIARRIHPQNDKFVYDSLTEQWKNTETSQIVNYIHYYTEGWINGLYINDLDVTLLGKAIKDNVPKGVVCASYVSDL